MLSRQELLTQINQVSFVINDLTLYLDTHPTQEQALSLFDKSMKERKKLLEEYEIQFEPLTIDCVKAEAQHGGKDYCSYPDQVHFHWVDGPTPWEGGNI